MHAFDLQLSDTVRAVELHPDGIYRSVSPGVLSCDAQFEWTAPESTFMA